MSAVLASPAAHAAQAPSARRALGRLRSAFQATSALPLALGVVYLLLGVWLMAGLGYFHGDALARVANALYAVASRDPHLAAMGLVWNPLPSLLALPLLVVLDPLGVPYLAAPIITAAFGAATLGLLDRIARLLGAPRWASTLLVLLFGLNPLVLFYAANGLSDLPFVFFLLAATYGYLRWVTLGGASNLATFAVTTALAFLVRYEAVPLAAGGVLAICAVFLTHRVFSQAGLEATLLTYLAPMAYMVGLWVFFNWTVTGDPLYFQRGLFSNAAWTTTLRDDGGRVASLAGSWGDALGYAVSLWVAACPPIVVLVPLAAVVVAVRRDAQLAGVLFMGLSVPVFHVWLLYTGQSFGWLRYFLYSVPLAFLLVAYMAMRVGQDSPRALRLRWGAGLAALALAAPLSLGALLSFDLGREDVAVWRAAVGAEGGVPPSYTFRTEREIAAALDMSQAYESVLLDSGSGFAINLFSRHHRRFVITSDREFSDILANPRGRVTHILVGLSGCAGQEVACAAQTDEIARAYPDLWKGQVPWAVLEREFGGAVQWRLFRVLPPEAQG